MAPSDVELSPPGGGALASLSASRASSWLITRVHRFPFAATSIVWERKIISQLNIFFFRYSSACNKVADVIRPIITLGLQLYLSKSEESEYVIIKCYISLRCTPYAAHIKQASARRQRWKHQ